MTRTSTCLTAATLCAGLALVLLGGCRSDMDMSTRLPYMYRAKVDARRVWVDVEVNGVTVLQVPEPAERNFGEYYSSHEEIEELTPWIEEGKNEVVFRVTAADDSGRQYRELELRKALVKERERERLFLSESRDLGVFTTTVVLEPPASGSCEPLSEKEREEVVGRTQELYAAVARGDFEAFIGIGVEDDPLVRVFGQSVKTGWELSEGAPPTITPLDLVSLRVVKSCAADAVFVTTKDGSPIFKYEFVAPDKHARHRNAIKYLAFRNIGGIWKDIY